jgi:NifU-like protein
MSLARLIQPSVWEKFPKKMREKIDRLRFGGFFHPEDSRGMRLVLGREGMLCLYWLVDESDGVIADAKFQAYGAPELLAIGEITTELVLRKTYDQASRITAELLDQQCRDKKDIPAFAKEAYCYLNQAISAIDRAVSKCLDIPFAVSHDATPIEYDFGETPRGIPEWEGLTEEQKRKIIEEVIEKEIRPYIELDAGGVSVVALKGSEVWIAYQGSCTSCHSSTGSTLSAIQKILQTRVFPGLTVIPQL